MGHGVGHGKLIAHGGFCFDIVSAHSNSLKESARSLVGLFVGLLGGLGCAFSGLVKLFYFSIHTSGTEYGAQGFAGECYAIVAFPFANHVFDGRPHAVEVEKVTHVAGGEGVVE